MYKYMHVTSNSSHMYTHTLLIHTYVHIHIHTHSTHAYIRAHTHTHTQYSCIHTCTHTYTHKYAISHLAPHHRSHMCSKCEPATPQIRGNMYSCTYVCLWLCMQVQVLRRECWEIQGCESRPKMYIHTYIRIYACHARSYVQSYCAIG